jgi:hypothetical protein
MAESSKESWKPFRQLLVIAALTAIGYACVHMLRFTIRPLNLIFVSAWLALPFLAIRPVSRLHRLPRFLGSALLAPLLLLSSILLLRTAVLDGLLGLTERTEALQTFQQGSCTIQLERYDYGGGVGVHGLNLEQRRPIAPGLWMVRSVDFFDDALEGALSVEGPYRVRVHAKGSYYSYDQTVDKVYSLKPWVYF